MLRARSVRSLGGIVAAAAISASLAVPACDGLLGIDDFKTGPCPEEGALQCSDTGVPQRCLANGQWLDERCDGDTPRYCDTSGNVKTTTACREGFGCTEATGACKHSRLDLLLVIDNSPAMADKQQILAKTIPDLIRGLVNPPCIDEATMAVTKVQPESSLDSCPEGARRTFDPLLDIHIGVVTSSLGGHGADTCANVETTVCSGGADNTSKNDLGRLVSRSDPCDEGVVPTYGDKGFLAWDPAGTSNPPGETDVGSIDFESALDAGADAGALNGLGTNAPGLIPSFKNLVVGAGQLGCGFESQLESWYRFLVDPEPYSTIGLDADAPGGQIVKSGTDETLLQQRRDFLRPDSILAVLMLSDENDCSIKEEAQSYLAAQQFYPGMSKRFHLPRARTECETSPNDPCCASCGEATPAGCAEDPACAANPFHDDASDDIHLRCWDQKRRFGVDFLHPIERYVQGLQGAEVSNRSGELVANPIYQDGLRDASMVFFAGIVGVPWQDIANDPKDLAKGFKSAAALATKDDKGNTTWDYILGDPANGVAPLDPLMIESNAVRTGTNPFTGEALAPPSQDPGPGPNSINGHEHAKEAAIDLQYACIFDLPAAHDCTGSDAVAVGCDCTDAENDKPLCEPTNPRLPTLTRTRQARGKAYPSLRQLSLIKELGPQGVVASICPADIRSFAEPQFGYRPATRALIDALQGSFPSPR